MSIVQRIYAVYDVVAEQVASQLMIFPSDNAAIRSFRDILDAPGTSFSTHPSDYVLCCFGELLGDGDSLGIASVEDPIRRPVMSGRDVIVAREQLRILESAVEKQDSEQLELV